MEHKDIPILGKVTDWMDDNDMDYGPLLAFVATVLLVAGVVFLSIAFSSILGAVVALMPIWLPLVLFLMFFWIWMEAMGTKFYLGQGRVTLRIKMPEEIFKSPEAMEVVISQIHNTASPDNLMQTYLDGKRPLPFSFEIVSIGGEIRFYVNLPRSKTKDAFEANMYAQYPGIEIIEEPVDYAAEITHDTDDYGWMAFHVGKKEDQEFPIKTYIDYKLDQMPKEEEKTDPMTPMLEVLTKARPHERIYIQIIAVSHRKKNFKLGQLSSAGTWESGVQEKISEIMQRDPKSRKPLTDENTESEGNMAPRITPGERDTIEAMERNMGKYAFETAVRWLYIFPKDQMNGDMINPILRSFSQYDIIGRNGLGPRWRTDLNYKQFTDPNFKRIDAMKREELMLYKLRLYKPQNGKGDAPKIFTSEELATIFHLPGRVAFTPGLGRIGSTRREAPPNLPTGASANE